MKNRIFRFLSSPTQRAIAGLALVFVLTFVAFGQWRSVFYRSDSWGYYLHLPAFFLYQDAGDYTATIAAWRPYNRTDPDPRIDQYGLRTSPTGRTVNKYTLGVATLQSPFFAVAHGWCRLTGASPADGFSWPYVLLAGLSTVFYAILGLFVLRKALLRHFSESTVAATLLALGFATNFFFFATYTVGMAHPYLFFLWSLLIWATQRWYERPAMWRSLLLGGSLGLIVVTRVPEILAVGVPLLWGIGGVRQRLRFWARHWRQIVLAVLAFGLVVFPQLWYWHAVSGEWIFNSYQGERFNWGDPQVLNGLFSFRNGWLVYTPVMALALVGVVWLRRLAGAAFWPLVWVLPLHIYIIYAWWCWQYINGFGSRPMVDVYPLLAFPLAALVAVAWPRSWSRFLVLGILGFCAALNLFQTWQVSRYILWSEHANRVYFEETWGAREASRAAFVAFESKERQPDTSKVFLHKPLFFNEIKDSTEANHQASQRLSPPWGCYCTGEFCLTTSALSDTSTLRPGDWVRASVQAFVPPEARERRIDKLARLTLVLSGPDGQIQKYREITVTSKIGNPRNILWHGGEAGQWGEAAFFVRVPPDYRPGGNLKLYVWNPDKQKLYLDDLRLDVWRAK
jgi:hypothetical protein